MMKEINWYSTVFKQTITEAFETQQAEDKLANYVGTKVPAFLGGTLTGMCHFSIPQWFRLSD